MFPDELKQYPQWVLWRNVQKQDGTVTKLPYNPHNNSLASVADPSTWGTFDEAATTAQRLITGIGFVLTNNDPFAFIDLDNPCGDVEIIQRHQLIAESFDSYSEVSPSGQGLHIILKGSVPEGKRRNKVEVYSSSRFMTMTGLTYQDRPIADRSYLLVRLWEELGGSTSNGSGNFVVEEKPMLNSDEEIYNQASSAQNGAKFLALWNGQFIEVGYKSQSEADFALINILGFYSRNSEQIARLFSYSALGKRDKAKRKDYVNKMIQRSFDNQVPMVDLTAIGKKLQFDLKLKANAEAHPYAGLMYENGFEIEDEYDYPMPPGLLGEITQFIYLAAPRQVKEIALAASIGLMSGICGRSYNISGTGLNNYILLLAGTGKGKDSLSSGIDKIMRQVAKQCPAALDFIGPSQIASGQALIKYLSKNPCFVSVLGEFGLMMQGLCSHQANAAQIMLRKMMLEMYMKSGAGMVMQSSIYSDKDKTTQAVNSPSFSMLGESTPESYYEALDEYMISQGLLPRFLTIEYTGIRPPLNPNHQFAKPPEELINSVSDLCTNCLSLAQNNRVLNVQMNEEATAVSDAFEIQTTESINTSEVSIAKELWNRAHLKVLKLSALIAIGVNPITPLITLEHIEWAKKLVERDVKNVFGRFEAGKVGRPTNEVNQISDIKDVVKEFLTSPFDQKMKNYGVPQQMHADRVVPLAYLQRRVMQRGSFRNDRMGAAFAIKRCIDVLISDGAVMKIRDIDLHNRYGKVMQAYIITDLKEFGLS